MMISLSLPPFAESHTIRSAYMIEGLTNLGFEFHLITAAVAPALADASLCTIIPESVSFWRTGLPRYDRWLYSLSRLNKPWLAYVYSNLAYRLWAPDPRRGWKVAALRLAREVHRRHPADLILSASGSCTAHLVASELKRQVGVPWVADLGDPWSWVDWQHKDTWLKAVQNSWLEARSLSRADLLICTTEETQHLYESRFNRGSLRSFVVPYGYREADFVGCRCASAGMPLRLAYIGSASRRERNLLPLIEAIAVRKYPLEMDLLVAGETSRWFQRAAERLRAPNVRFIGRVSYTESIRYICDAAILILIGNKSPYQVPGKTFLYLASGRPLLYLFQSPPSADPTVRILQRFPGVRFVPNEARSIALFLAELSEADFRKWEAEAFLRIDMSELRRFEAGNVAGELSCVLRQLVTDA